MITVIVVYCVLNFIIQSVLQPRFVWAYILGPIGAALAIPASLFVKAILVDIDPDAKWLQLFPGDEPVFTKKTRRTPEAVAAEGEDPERGPLMQALLLAAGIALCGAALLIEIQMADHAGYQPWHVRFRLGRKARERVNLQLLRNSLDDELTCGHRADEARLVIVAKAIAGSITRSATWRSDFLDRHNLRCDVELDLVGIARGALDLRNQRRETARNSTDQLPTNAADVGTDRWNALLTRLAWLHRYLTQLQTLAAGTTQASQPENLGTTASSELITTEIRFTIMAQEGLTPDTGGIGR
ncbi:MAG TPA: hypothetical protein VIU11_01880 [Nakamurella sp.]